MNVEESTSTQIKYSEHKNVTSKLVKPTSKSSMPKTIRFSILDENVTDDSSSDQEEESSPHVHRVKKYVNEIKIEKPTKKKYKGVRQRSWGKWGAEITDRHLKGNKRVWLGTFETAEEAAMAYNEAAIRIRGKDAKINSIVPSDQDQDQNQNLSLSPSSVLSSDVKSKILVQDQEVVVAAAATHQKYKGVRQLSSRNNAHCNVTYQSQNLFSSPSSFDFSEAGAYGCSTEPVFFGGGNSMFDSNSEFLQFQPVFDF